jgi:putative flippase GtrA
VRFLIVGGASFALDVSVMSALIYGLGLVESSTGVMLSRVAAWASAITLAYFLNARLTFGASIRHSRFANYLLIQAIGAGINLGSFFALVLVGPLNDKPLVGMVIGNVLAMTNNFILVRKFVYRFHPEVDDPQ